jgi:A/G-specific adenine glycosylase
MARLHAVETPLPQAKNELTALAEGLTPRPAARRLCPGGDGPRRHDLHPAQPRLRHLPVAHALPRPRPWDRRRPAAQDAESGEAHPLGIAYLAGATMAPGCWNAARTAGCWAACWAGPARTGPKPEPKPAADGRLAGRGHRGAPHLHPFPPAPRAARGAGRPRARPSRGSFVAQSDFRPGDLPTVMRKAFDLARHHPALSSR